MNLSGRQEKWSEEEYGVVRKRYRNISNHDSPARLVERVSNAPRFVASHPRYRVLIGEIQTLLVK
jgi:hypothetical protein